VVWTTVNRTKQIWGRRSAAADRRTNLHIGQREPAPASSKTFASGIYVPFAERSYLILAAHDRAAPGLPYGAIIQPTSRDVSLIVDGLPEGAVKTSWIERARNRAVARFRRGCWTSPQWHPVRDKRRWDSPALWTGWLSLVSADWRRPSVSDRRTIRAGQVVVDLCNETADRNDLGRRYRRLFRHDGSRRGEDS
jgi:hypothetical protein